MSSVDELLSDVLKLPERERARIAHELLQSLDGGDEPEAEEEWDKEIQRRASEVLEGKAKTVPWEAVEARVNARARKKG